MRVETRPSVVQSSSGVRTASLPKEGFPFLPLERQDVLVVALSLTGYS